MRDDSFLEELIRKTVDLPSMPTVAARVMQLTDGTEVSIAQLEEIISKDQAFSTRLLRIANSAFYRRHREIDTIPAALMLIGFRTLKSLVVAASTRDLSRRAGPLEALLWEHSLGVSIAASLLAVQTGLVSPEEALVAGLVHDVGKTVLNNSIPEKYAPLVRKAYETGADSVVIEAEALGFTHCEVGGLVARKWKLPALLEHVIEYHHPARQPNSPDSSSEALCQVVSAADALCLRAGIGMSPLPNVRVPLDTLGLPPEKLDDLMVTFKQKYRAERKQLADTP